MGRHTHGPGGERPRRLTWLIATVAGLAVLFIAVASVIIYRAATGGNAAGPGCEDPVAVTIVADPAIAGALETIAADVALTSETCVEATVTSTPSADTASVLAAGGDADAAVWIPSGTAWVERTAATAASLGRPAPELDVGDPIASTPIVLAAPAARAQDFAAEPPGWASILGGRFAGVLPDPEASAESLAGLLALRAQTSAEDPRQFAGALIELGKTIPASLDAAFAAAETAGVPTAVITSEQAVVAHNQDESATPFIALYPSEGTTSLLYPFIRLPDATKAQAEVVDVLEAAFADGSKALHSAGFRDADGGGEVDAEGVIAEPTEASPAADGAAQIEILRTWGVLNLRSRMLAVIDVSGSMEEPAAGGLRRIDVFQQAAAGAVGRFSGEVELGAWVFSTDRQGEQDWEELAPIAPLSDPAHKQRIGEIIASLPSRLGGGTGLYNTTLAAVKAVRDTYDPAKVNTVLLITDGKNEDSLGLDLPALLAELAAIDDPLKPVPVIMIGFGPDTDLAAMGQIAAATGGAAYSAAVPEDLGQVLVDALVQRSCRPNC